MVQTLHASPLRARRKSASKANSVETKAYLLELKKLRRGLSSRQMGTEGSEIEAMQSVGHTMRPKGILSVVYKVFILGSVAEWRGSYWHIYAQIVKVLNGLFVSVSAENASTTPFHLVMHPLVDLMQTSGL